MTVKWIEGPKYIDLADMIHWPPHGQREESRPVPDMYFNSARIGMVLSRAISRHQVHNPYLYIWLRPSNGRRNQPPTAMWSFKCKPRSVDGLPFFIARDKQTNGFWYATTMTTITLSAAMDFDGLRTGLALDVAAPVILAIAPLSHLDSLGLVAPSAAHRATAAAAGWVFVAGTEKNPTRTKRH